MLLARLAGMFRAGRADRELRAEIESHIEEATEELTRQGLAPEAARREALRRFGGVSRIEEMHRDARTVRWLGDAARDVRHAVRSLRRTPGFSLVVIVVLAAAMAAATSVLTLLNAVVLRPLPFAESDRLVSIRHAAPGLESTEVGLSSGLYFHYLEQARNLGSLAVYRERVLNIQLPGRGTERVNMASVGHDLFDVLHVRPALGRRFTEADGAPGFMDNTWTVPVVLAHGFWMSRLGGDPDVVGRVLTINDLPRVVIGVLPEEVRFPDRHTEIWVLSEMAADRGRFAWSFDLRAVARMRPGATIESTEAELARLIPQIEGRYPDATADRIAALGLHPIVVPLKDQVIGDVADVLWPLFGGMTLLLLIASLNVTCLFLVRAEARRSEMAVRQALGAGRAQVARLFLVEALLLTTTAGALGLWLAHGALSATLSSLPFELPRAAEVGIGGVAIAFVGGMSAAMAVWCAALALRRQTQHASGGGGSAPWAAWATAGHRERRRRDVAIALQVAFALALLAGSALMVETFRHLSSRELGFSPNNMLTMKVSLPYSKAGAEARIFAALADRLRQLPGAEAVSAATTTPLDGLPYTYPIDRGEPAEPSVVVPAPIPVKFFLPGYFQTMETAIVAGAGMAAGEPVAEPYAVLVNEALARRLYPDGRAIGQTVRWLSEDGSVRRMGRPAGPIHDFTIVGIVADVREGTLRDGPVEALYIPALEPRVEPSMVPLNMTFVMRTHVDPMSLAAVARVAVAEVEPALSVGRIRTMASIVGVARGREAFVGGLLSTASLVAVFLGLVGIYGSVAEAARRRTREIGVRVALGARRVEIVRLVVANSLVAAGIGAVLGVALALVAARALESLLFQVDARDPTVLTVVTTALLLAAGGAAMLAAVHTTRADPLRVLRAE